MSGIASACGVGTFSNMSGHSSCALCPSGFVTAQSNSTGCVACDAGSYLPVSGVECVPCPAGEFANTTASSECSPCPPGYVSSSKSGSFTCTACVAGTYSDGSTAAYQCLICAPGTYTLMNASTDCASCANVVGTFCEKGAVVIDTGYWGYVTSDNRIATAPCRASLCENGLIGRQCASGRQASATNALCGACDPGWSEWNGQCLGNALCITPILPLNLIFQNNQVVFLCWLIFARLLSRYKRWSGLPFRYCQLVFCICHSCDFSTKK